MCTKIIDRSGWKKYDLNFILFNLCGCWLAYSAFFWHVFGCFNWGLQTLISISFLFSLNQIQLNLGTTYKLAAEPRILHTLDKLFLEQLFLVLSLLCNSFEYYHSLSSTLDRSFYYWSRSPAEILYINLQLSLSRQI